MIITIKYECHNLVIKHFRGMNRPNKTTQNNSKSTHTTKRRDMMEDGGVFDQISPVKSYLETLKKHPEGIKFGGQYRRTEAAEKQPKSTLELNNARNNILVTKSNIRNIEEDCTILSNCDEANQFINVQHSLNDTVSNLASGDYTKMNYSDRSIAYTKTNDIKPLRISSSIKDIQGMLVTNLNAKTSYFNNNSDASLAISSSPCRKVDTYSLENRDKCYPYNRNSSREQNSYDKRGIESALSENNIFHGYRVSGFPKSFTNVQTTLAADVKCMADNVLDRKIIGKEIMEDMTEGTLIVFIFHI